MSAPRSRSLEVEVALADRAWRGARRASARQPARDRVDRVRRRSSPTRRRRWRAATRTSTSKSSAAPPTAAAPTGWPGGRAGRRRAVSRGAACRARTTGRRGTRVERPRVSRSSRRRPGSAGCEVRSTRQPRRLDRGHDVAAREPAQVGRVAVAPARCSRTSRAGRGRGRARRGAHWGPRRGAARRGRRRQQPAQDGVRVARGARARRGRGSCRTGRPGGRVPPRPPTDDLVVDARAPARPGRAGSMPVRRVAPAARSARPTRAGAAADVEHAAQRGRQRGDDVRRGRWRSSPRPSCRLHRPQEPLGQRSRGVHPCPRQRRRLQLGVAVLVEGVDRRSGRRRRGTRCSSRGSARAART